MSGDKQKKMQESHLLARFLVAAGTATVVALGVVLLPRLLVWLAEQPRWPVFALVWTLVFVVGMISLEVVRE